MRVDVERLRQKWQEMKQTDDDDDELVQASFNRLHARIGEFIFIMSCIGLVVVEISGTDAYQTLMISCIALGIGSSAYFGYKAKATELEERIRRLENGTEFE